MLEKGINCGCVDCFVLIGREVLKMRYMIGEIVDFKGRPRMSGLNECVKRVARVERAESRNLINFHDEVSLQPLCPTYNSHVLSSNSLYMASSYDN